MTRPPEREARTETFDVDADVPRDSSMDVELASRRELAMGRDQDAAGRGTPEWSRAVAKWFAICILGAIGTVGLVWSIWFRPMPARLHRAEPAAAGVPAALARDRGAAVSSHDAGERPAMMNESAESAQSRESGAGGSPREQEFRAPKAALTGTIDINQAGLTELQLLPGIGPALAQRILDDRLKNGPYRSADDLDRVRGIGPKTLEKLRPLIRVN
jgi:competence ComEA-like helix-hairpin-helix protein